MIRQKLPLKKHAVLPSAYVTHDEQYLIYKDPKDKFWYWGFYSPSIKKYNKQPFQYRTLNDCKFDVKEQIQQQGEDKELWQE